MRARSYAESQAAAKRSPASYSLLALGCPDAMLSGEYRMTGSEYKSRRKALELTQGELADWLGVTLNTISRRESGELPVTPEAELALRHLAFVGTNPRFHGFIEDSEESLFLVFSPEALSWSTGEREFRNFYRAEERSYIFRGGQAKQRIQQFRNRVKAAGFKIRTNVCRNYEL